MRPSGADKRTGRNETSLSAPCTRVFRISVSAFYSSLRNGIECRECAQIQEIRAGSNQLNGKGRSVFACFHLQGSVIVLRDHVCKVSVVSSGIRICQSLPAVFHIGSGQRGSVGPGQTILHGEGIGQAIFTLGIALRKIRSKLSVLIISEQTGESKDCQAGSVNRGVQRRIQLIRLGSDLQGQGVARSGRKSEILIAIQVRIDVIHILRLHVNIVIVVQGHDCPGAHQLVLSLMHQSFAGCQISGRLDLGDSRIIVFPCRRSLAGRAMLSGCGSFFRGSFRRSLGGFRSFSALSGRLNGGLCGCRAFRRGRRRTTACESTDNHGSSQH